jgi:hypothetical protein
VAAPGRRRARRHGREPGSLQPTGPLSGRPYTRSVGRASGSIAGGSWRPDRRCSPPVYSRESSAAPERSPPPTRLRVIVCRTVSNGFYLYVGPLPLWTSSGSKSSMALAGGDSDTPANQGPSTDRTGPSDPNRRFRRACQSRSVPPPIHHQRRDGGLTRL